MTATDKKCPWSGYVMHRTDGKWATRERDWPSRNDRSQGKQRTRWGIKNKALVTAVESNYHQAEVIDLVCDITIVILSKEKMS